MKRVRFIAIPLLAVLMGTALLLPVSAGAASSHAAAPQASTTCSTTATCPVTGTVTNKQGHAVGTFTGTLKITQFAVQNGQIVALGTLSGTAINKGGGVISTITNRAVTVPVASIDPTCTILTLTLGPLDLNVLGLMVHLNQVVLTITANPAGGLLGQLLCSLANAFPTATLQQIVNLLNQILALL